MTKRARWGKAAHIWNKKMTPKQRQKFIDRAGSSAMGLALFKRENGI